MNVISDYYSLLSGLIEGHNSRILSAVTRDVINCPWLYLQEHSIMVGSLRKLSLLLSRRPMSTRSDLVELVHHARISTRPLLISASKSTITRLSPKTSLMAIRTREDRINVYPTPACYGDGFINLSHRAISMRSSVMLDNGSIYLCGPLHRKHVQEHLIPIRDDGEGVKLVPSALPPPIRAHCDRPLYETSDEHIHTAEVPCSLNPLSFPRRAWLGSVHVAAFKNTSPQ